MFKVQIDAFINVYFSIMEIAVVTYVRIGRIRFNNMYLSACFITFYKYVLFKISLLLLVYILFNYCVPKMLICVIMGFC